MMALDEILCQWRLRSFSHTLPQSRDRLVPKAEKPALAPWRSRKYP